jgi:hypothetical protein
VQLYVGNNAGRAVNTEDLRIAFERAAGRSLRRFFDQWVLQSGHPEFESSWQFDPERQRILIPLNQVHEQESGLPPAFAGSMGVAIRTEEGRVYHRIEFSERRQTIELPCTSRPFWVQLDPESVLPARLSQKRSERAWLALGESGTAPNDETDTPFDGIARLRAIHHYGEQLDEIPETLKEARLSMIRRMAQSDPNPHVQRQAIESLTHLNGDSSREAMRFLARSSDHTQVRVAALNAMRALPPVDITAGFAKATYEVGHSWQTMGAAMALWVHADPKGAWQRIQTESETPEAHRALGPELVQASAAIPASQRIPWLLAKSTPELGGSRLRQAALEALGPHTDRIVVRDWLIESLKSPFFGVRRAAVQGLVMHLDPVGRQALIRHYETLTDVRQKRTIENALNAQPAKLVTLPVVSR